MSIRPRPPITEQAANGRLLVVDDDRRAASALAEWLCGLGFHASAVGTAAEAARSLRRSPCDACIVDATLPDGGARDVIAAVRAAAPQAGVVAVLQGGDAPTGLGADAAIVAPIGDEQLLAALAAARHAAPPEPGRGGTFLLGRHPAIRRALDVVERIAATPATVLITGESGTGKSLLAREIHAASRRRGEFVEVACGALSESLLESELFGHVTGAFTGATSDRDGRFLQADGGTLFLDEIATASPAMQVRLLRVMQDGRFEPVGGTGTRQVDARVVLATHEDLEQLVADGAFRADLFWRINVVTIEMPSLRDRAADIPLLADHFLGKSATRAGRDVAGFSAAATEALLRHRWPGNVRELEHAVERAVLLGRGPVVEIEDLPPAVLSGRPPRFTAAVSPAPLKQALASPERRLILEALERSGWRRDIAARALGINRTTLYKKIRRLGMDLADYEPGDVASSTSTGR